MPSHMISEKLPLKPENRSIAAFKNFVRQQNSTRTQKSVHRISLMARSPMPTPENALRDQCCSVLHNGTDVQLKSQSPEDVQTTVTERATNFVKVRKFEFEDTVCDLEDTCERTVPLRDILGLEEHLDSFSKLQSKREPHENPDLCTESTPEKEHEQALPRSVCTLRLRF